MFKTHPTVFRFNVWKEHRCIDCGLPYRYLLQRMKVGHGRTPRMAEANAHEGARKVFGTEVEMQPCPGCGLYQPDMIAARRWRWHGFVLLGSMFTLAGIIFVVAHDLLASSTVGWLAVCGVGVLALAQRVVLANPNAHRAANLALAHRRQVAGDVWVPEGQKPQPTGADAGNGITRMHGVCHLLLAFAALAFITPAGLRLTSGMKSDPNWHPEVVGPGDAAYIYFPESIWGIKSLWRGTPHVTLLNAAELGLPNPPVIIATSNEATWAGTIEKAKKESSRLWARIQVPDHSTLAGKVLRLRIDLDVTFPQEFITQKYIVRQARYTLTTTLALSAPGTGFVYLVTWWLCFITGIGLTILSAAMLPFASRRFREKAISATLFEPEVPELSREQPTKRASRNEGRYRSRDSERHDRDDEDDRPRRRRDEDDRDERYRR